MFSLRDAKFRHNPLCLCEDGIVATTGAPACVLIGFKILSGESGEAPAGIREGSFSSHGLFTAFFSKPYQQEKGYCRRCGLSVPDFFKYLVNFGLQLKNVERLSLDFVKSDGIDEIGATDELTELTCCLVQGLKLF